MIFVQLEMENKVKHPKKGASFLKVLDDDFCNQLILPPAFCKEFNGKIPPWFIIEMAGSRKCWRVDVEYDVDDGLRFTNGWNEFVDAHALELGNFLVFLYKRKLIFEVTIYAKDGSEKTEDQISKFEEDRVDSEDQHRSSNICLAEADQTSEDEEQQQADGSTKRKIKRTTSIIENGSGFSITWKETKNSHYYLTIPKAVVLENKLSSKTLIVLKDLEDRSWQVKLTTRLDGRVDLTKGWREFISANKFTVGSTLIFKFLSDKLIQVHVQSPSPVDHLSQSSKRCRNIPTKSLDIADEYVESGTTCKVNYEPPEVLGHTRVCPAFIASSFSTTCTVLSRGSYLHIPMRVAKEQNLQNQLIVVLYDEEGRHWKMGVNRRRSDGRFSLVRGWSEFWRKKKISIGDTLNFEFVADRMMKVNIKRALQVNHAVKEAVVKQEMVDIDFCS